MNQELSSLNVVVNWLNILELLKLIYFI